MKPKQLLLICAIFIVHSISFTQTLSKNYIVTDGPVNAFAQKGDTLYIGGAFNNVGYRIHQMARFKSGDSLPDLKFDKLKAESDVVGLEPDDSGGYFLALSACTCCYQPFIFEYAGKDYTTPILHLFADFSVDTSFAPVTLSGGCLTTIKKQGKRLYLGGSFTSVDGSPRQGLAAISASTGNLILWTPQNVVSGINRIEANGSKVITLNSDGKYYTYNSTSGTLLNLLSVDGSVSGILVDQDKLYVGGRFSNVIQNAKGLVTFTQDSLYLNPNFPQLDAGGSYVNSIVGDDSGGYYIGGYFSIANKKYRNIAHILSNGLIDTNFKVTVSDEVSCLARDKNILYVGGTFTTINNESRGYGAAIDLSSAQLTSFDPQADSYIQCMEPVGDTIYLGGYFYTLRNHSRHLAGAVTIGNVVTSWNPDPDQPVFQISSNKNNKTLFISGEFLTVKGSDIPYLSKVNAVSGKPSNWRPAPDYPVYSLLQNGSNLYIGGGFTKVGNVARTCLAAIDTATLKVTSFAPNPDGGVQGISIADNQLYIAGYFTKIFGQTRPHVAGIDLSTNTLTPFSQNFDDETMRSIYFNDSLLAVGGEFTGIRQAKRNQFAVINLNENQLNSYNTKNYFSPGNFGSIDRIYRNKNDLFFAGDFSYADGKNYCKNLLALNIDTVKVTHVFNEYPDLLGYPDYNISQLSVYDNKLFVVGGFKDLLYTSNQFEEVPRLNIAVFDLQTNELTPDRYEPNRQVYNLVKDKSGNIVFTGRFDLVKTSPRQNLAALDINTGYVTAWHPSCDNWVNTFALKDSSLYVGGSFDYINDGVHLESPSFLACINTNTGLLTDWNYSLDDFVSALAIQDSTLYIGGGFHNIGNIQRYYAAAVYLSGSGGLTNWNPNPNIFVHAIYPYHKEIYLGGVFTEINNADQKYLAKVTNTDGRLLHWKPEPNGYVSDLYLFGNSLYVGGNFTAMKLKNRNGLAAFDISSGDILPFNAAIQYNSISYSNTVGTILAFNNQLYIGSGNIARIKGKNYGNLFSIDTTGMNISGFHPRPNGTVNTLLVANNKLFVGGTWDSIAHEDLSNFAVFTLDSLAKPLDYTNTQINSTTNLQAIGDYTGIKVNVFPNPVTHDALVSIKNIDGLTTVTLTDISGKVLWQTRKMVSSILTIPMEKLSSGTYLLMIENRGKLSSCKIIKQ